MKKFLMKGYRSLQKRLIKNHILPFFFSKERQERSWRPIERGIEKTQNKRIWFHAASVGELESIWLLIHQSAEKGMEIVLSILSESAAKTLSQLESSLKERGAKVLYCGYSPWEGEWKEALQTLKPDLFLTAKYEAWPDLWISLQELGIPLSMVSVHERKSLKIAKSICEALIGDVPQLLLFPCVPSEVSGLKKLFPEAWVEVSGEPRWDRVFLRSQKGNPRAKELIEIFESAVRPWGIIGSAWIEDLKFLKTFLAEVEGTLWIVPHQIGSNDVDEMEEFLKAQGLRPIRTSKNKDLKPAESIEPRSCILVDEMGFLSELYSVAEWAYVGGGWGAGIHSTIEPAIHGIPIGVGPQGIQKFYEVDELTGSGQLEVLRTQEDLTRWKKKWMTLSADQRKVWSEEARSRLGATQKILTTIEKFLTEHARLLI